MRLLRAIALVGLGLSGCLDGNAPEPLAGISPGLQEAIDSGLEGVDSILGLTLGEGGTSLRYDLLEGMEIDSISILAVQVLADTEMTYATEKSLQFQQPPPLSEQRDVDSVCSFDINWSQNAPGDYFLARATGDGSARMPADHDFGGSAGYSFGNGGSSGRKGGGNGHLDRGEWFIVIAGLAGYDPGLARQDGSWTLEFESTAPLRVVRLQSAQYACGLGFRNLPGAAVTPDPIPLYQDGSLTIDGLYGATFGFCPNVGDIVGPLYDQASVDFMGNVTELSPVVKTAFEDPARGDVTLAVRQWAGDPVWVLASLWLPQGPSWSMCAP